MEALQQVVTVAEAAKMAHVTKWAIMHHIDSGRLVHRLAGRFYLVSLESLLEIYPHAKKTPRKAVQTAV